ncbi:MAG: protein kinase domain-containing protein [Gemmataceae bacterium]
MIHFSCAHCGMKFEVKPEFGGRQTTCPTCKQPLIVPVPAAVPMSPAADGVGPTLLLQQVIPFEGVTLAATGALEEVPLTGADHPPPAALRPVREILESRPPGDARRYVIAGEIARGGMGAICRAVDCDIRREVAIKYLLNQADARHKIRFVEEAQITGQLEHPNIVPIHELGVDGRQQLFFSMKMVRGRSLAQVLKALRQRTPEVEQEYTLTRLLTIFVNICNALAYAHSRCVVHRDLKPANIMLGSFGEVYVMDWGLAKVFGQDAPPWHAEQPADLSVAQVKTSTYPTQNGSPELITDRLLDSDLTRDGTVLGTPAYMPPEQALGKVAELDERCDIYSLGAILYEMLTLQPPVDPKGGTKEVLKRVIEGAIVPPKLRSPQRFQAGLIPKELSAIALKALARDPVERYLTVERLRGDIELFLEGRSVSVKPDTTWETTVKLVKRNKAVSAVSAAAALLLLMVLAGSAWLNYQSRLQTEDALQDYRAHVSKSIPAFLEAARMSVNRRDFAEALNRVQLAVESNSNHLEARMLKGQILVALLDIERARDEFDFCRQRDPNNRDAQELVRLCWRYKPDDVQILLAFANVFQRQKATAVAEEMYRQTADNLQARKARLADYRQRIDAAWPGAGKNLSMDEVGHFKMHITDTHHEVVKDLIPLRDIPLTSLAIFNCDRLEELTPLQGMPLTSLHLYSCPKVRNLVPLQGMALTYLGLHNCGQIRDLTPLQGMPLTHLSIAGCGFIQDLTPLHGMPLTTFIAQGCSQIRNLAPLQGMPLTTLNFHSCRNIEDLTPLRGMKLTSLEMTNCEKIHDLTPLRDMPLTYLSVPGSAIRDLEPLRDMPLTTLSIYSCDQLKDLSPLQGLPLTSLNIAGCKGLHDLTPLVGMKLEKIHFSPRYIDKGMEVLRGMKSLQAIALDRGDFIKAEDFWKRYDAGEFDK